MKLYFVTSNPNKVREVRLIIKDYDIEQYDMELPELQGEQEEIVRQKAKMAVKTIKKPCFVEDTALCFNALNGLPGEYIKHFIERLGLKNVYKLLDGFEDKSAKAVAMIGYCEPGKEPVIIKGDINGTIVMPRGKSNFGWDPIFQPDGKDKTYGEMTEEEKNSKSHREMVVIKFKEFLENL